MFSEKTYLLSALMLSLLRCQEEEGRKKGGGGGKGQLVEKRSMEEAINDNHTFVSSVICTTLASRKKNTTHRNLANQKYLAKKCFNKSVWGF